MTYRFVTKGIYQRQFVGAADSSLARGKENRKRKQKEKKKKERSETWFSARERYRSIMPEHNGAGINYRSFSRSFRNDIRRRARAWNYIILWISVTRTRSFATPVWQTPFWNLLRLLVTSDEQSYFVRTQSGSLQRFVFFCWNDGTRNTKLHASRYGSGTLHALLFNFSDLKARVMCATWREARLINLKLSYYVICIPAFPGASRA